ncbi:hypothetical protein O6H91_01G029100 [Diphasiastrum complanatum]|nr:hypothetical protein O6H91_01G029100 [Diphasiastrum complanatum]
MADRMKVRARAAAGGPTHKLQVRSPFRLQDLKDELSLLTSLPAASLTISLNKKDTIQGDSEATLASLGITGGDLVFYFSSADSLIAAASAEKSHVSGDPEQGFLFKSASESLGVSEIGRVEVERHSRAVASGGTSRTRGLSEQHAGSDEDSVRRELCASAALQRMSASLGFEERSLKLDAGGADNGTMNASGSCESAVDLGTGCLDESDERARMTGSPDVEEQPKRYDFLIPDLLQRVLAKEGDNVSQPEGVLVLALHAVMLETGFVTAQASEEMAPCDPYALPSSWSVKRGMFDLNYTLPDLLTSSAAASLPTAEAVKVVLRCQTVGSFLVVYGTLIGGISSDIYRLSLSISKYLGEHVDELWSQCLQCRAEVNGGPTDRQSDSMKVAANSTKKRLRGDDVESSCSRNGSLEIFSNIFEFWKEVKDNLSLCLLTALCERSGLPPPPSFLLLPTELKMRILEMLPAPALASLGCVCSELRFLASSHDLWKERYKQEFGLRERNQGSEYGWKSAFAREWVRRKQREDGLQDHRMRLRAETFPVRLRLPPFLGPGFGIIGGDYDLLPTLHGRFGGGTGPGGLGGGFRSGGGGGFLRGLPGSDSSILGNNLDDQNSELLDDSSLI